MTCAKIGLDWGSPATVFYELEYRRKAGRTSQGLPYRFTCLLLGCRVRRNA